MPTVLKVVVSALGPFEEKRKEALVRKFIPSGRVLLDGQTVTDPLQPIPPGEHTLSILDGTEFSFTCIVREVRTLAVEIVGKPGVTLATHWNEPVRANPPAPAPGDE